uniref:RNA helicase n=1 Tax=Hirondellea gigas TaxID=1518452 RepID=A0A6A7FYE3_9CRUS
MAKKRQRRSENESSSESTERDDTSVDLEELEKIKKKKLKHDKKKRKLERKEKSEKKSRKKAKKIKLEIDDESKDESKEESKEESKSESSVTNFRIPQDIVDVLAKDSIVELFEIQCKSFDPVFDGLDFMGRAHTGQGKTLAFVLPVISKLKSENDASRKRFGRSPSVIVLCPVRELAIQVAKVFEQIAIGMSVCTVYGGTAYSTQMSQLRRGVDIVVGTCGRVKDLIDRGALRLNEIRFVILDEADEMLNIGFADDVETILGRIEGGVVVDNDIYSDEPKKTATRKHQALLFSATIPSWVQGIAHKYFAKDRVIIDLVGNTEQQASKSVEHYAICCHWSERAEVLPDILRVHTDSNSRTIIFCETRKECNDLAQNPGIKQGCQVLHGEIPQAQRQVTTQGFRDGLFPMLVATDVAARGLDIPGVTLIIQIEPPKSHETYIHRSGRTGRAGATGKSILFYTPKQSEFLSGIERRAGITFIRIGAPQAKDLVSATAEDSLKAIDGISSETAAFFNDHAKKLLDSKDPISCISAALAAISGYNETAKHRSLLCGSNGFITILADAQAKTDQQSIWQTCKALLNQDAFAIKNMTMSKDGTKAVFDIASDHLDLINSLSSRSAYPLRSLALSVCSELPPLASFSIYKQHSGGFGGGNGRYSSGNRNGYGNRNGFRNGNYSRNQSRSGGNRRGSSRGGSRRGGGGGRRW